MNPIQAIQQQGQSLWYDNIRRGLIESGELATLIAQGITGVTSNPTIFEKAIDGSRDYDAAIEQLAASGADVDRAYDALVLSDIGRGADLLLPVYNQSQARDGYISIEVPPTLAEDTEATIAEAHRLFDALNRPNIMIKVPATPKGIPAIRRLIADGINVNVTLIFSLDAYRAVINAYIEGLEERRANGLSLDRVASVASFFVSRVDTLVDRLIEQGHKDPDLAGKAGIANAKLAYQVFLETFNGPRFADLKKAGAMVQRPLWASTSTKNPNYPDLLYVEALIGPDTVDTLPPATVEAILDHGHAARTIDQNLDEARRVLERLEASGIAFRDVTDQLLKEGVASFHQSFVTLRESLANKLAQAAHQDAPCQYLLGAHQPVVDETIQTLNHDRAVPRLWEHDATLWSQDPDHHQIIRNALGWLDVPQQVLEQVESIQHFAREVVLDGFQHAVVLGMGGSSLVSDVLTHSFETGQPGLDLTILDTTHAERIRRLTAELPLPKTLFIVASKSGTTTEPNAFYHYFWEVLQSRGLDPAKQFVAITDPGTAMQKEAESHHFRRIFLNPADIGGRYSALSWFGMVPAALHGIDIARFLQDALSMRKACQTEDVAQNPGASLGATLGALAKQGRDKVTFLMPDQIAHLGDWLEQLLAESTGKLGTGLVPVAHEPIQPAQTYGRDRVFVDYQWQETHSPIADTLAQQGHPVIRIRLQNPYQLAGEFYRWEIATAIAGAVLQIDAFDQPNVQESKDNTKAILAKLDGGHLPHETLQHEGDMAWTASPALVQSTLAETLQALFKLGRPHSYIALMAYLDQTPDIDRALTEWRDRLVSATGQAVTLGYGPRFLHSTGQLHKGGPATGLFVQVVSATGPKLAVPGDGYDFMTLMHAQALGDFQSLLNHGRPVIRILVPASPLPSIKTLTEWSQKYATEVHS